MGEEGGGVLGKARGGGGAGGGGGGWTGTKTGRGPAATMAHTVGTAVLGAVMTASPGPTPVARSARWSASVPEPTPTAWRAPQVGAHSRSKGGRSPPRRRRPPPRGFRHPPRGSPPL